MAHRDRKIAPLKNHEKRKTMPGLDLTVDTSSPKSQSQHSRGNSSSQSFSRSTSPIQPPYSPITPTNELANPLATSAYGSARQRQTYAHSQAPQIAIPQPAPTPIKLDENTDALALKSAISILQMQARNAENDIKNLARMKEKAVRNPVEFARALAAGEVHTKSDSLFEPSADDEEDQEMSDHPEPVDQPPQHANPFLFNGQGQGQFTMDANGSMNAPVKEAKAEHWGGIPKPQNVVRCPPINWNKYAVVGESLDKLHVDQVRRPTEGKPQVLGADGKLHFGGDAVRRTVDGVAAPYAPGKDKIEKMGARKGGKR